MAEVELGEDNRLSAGNIIYERVNKMTLTDTLRQLWTMPYPPTASLAPLCSLQASKVQR